MGLKHLIKWATEEQNRYLKEQEIAERTYGDGIPIKTECWHYDHDLCKYSDPTHCNHQSISGQTMQCPRLDFRTKDEASQK